MIGFNMLLESEGVCPADVRLVRHQDTRVKKRTPYDFWLAGDTRFEAYQNLQAGPVFGTQSFIASFVVTPLRETLFAGMYAIHGSEPAPLGVFCPLTELPCSDHLLYRTSLSPLLAGYRGKVIIDWGPGYINWIQLAAKQNKQILEIRRMNHVPAFPGYLDFKATLHELQSLPLQWREILQAAAGIYVLTHPITGKQYVGSAQGVVGFWGRWSQYLANGHGGNQGLEELEPANYSVAILEIISPNIGAEAVIEIEQRWKIKLGTRTFGLNKN